MGILLVYDVTDETSFANIRNWARNVDQHAAESVGGCGRGGAKWLWLLIQGTAVVGSGTTGCSVAVRSF
jgi:GTPase SAR1 family protein